MARFLEVLGAGRSVMIFPEGGRQRGPGLGRPRSGVGYLALNSGVTVVPIYADGTGSLWRSLWRKPPLRIYHGRPIRIHPDNLERHCNADGYREFGEMVLEAIQALKDEHEAGH